MKNKILSTLCIFILISCAFINNTVFASALADNHSIASFSQNVIDYAYMLPEYNENMNVIIRNGDYMSKIVVLLFSKDLDIKFYAEYRNYSGNIFVKAYPDDFDYVEYQLTVDEENNISISSGPNYKGTWEPYFDGYDNDDGSTSTNLYSTVGIYSDNTYTDFFIRPPVTLAEVLEVARPAAIFKKLMKSVLVSLVVFLVGLLTFSKAWKWLKTQLLMA